MQPEPFQRKEPIRSGLTDAHGLLLALWPEAESRPSLRWLREQQARRTVPYIKIGRRVFFDPLQVRRAIEKNFSVEAAPLSGHLR